MYKGEGWEWGGVGRVVLNYLWCLHQDGETNGSNVPTCLPKED